MEASPLELRAPLGFTRAEDVGPDSERPGLLRARTLPFGLDPVQAFEFRSCALNDCNDPRTEVPELEQAGFETIDLSGHPSVQWALATIRREDRVSEASAEALRESLRGARIRLCGGKSL